MNIFFCFFSPLHQNKNRIGIPWNELPTHLHMHGRKIEWEPKDGLCLLHSLSDLMWNEFHELYSVEILKTLIIAEIEDNNDRYQRCFDGTLFELLTSVHNYLNKGNYAQDCVDLCVDAAAWILNRSINIGIFQNVGGSAQCINYFSERPTNRDIFLCYDKQHYESIIFLDTVNIMADKYKKKQGSKPKVEDLGLEEEEIGNENAPYSLQSTNNFSRPLLPPPLPKMPKKSHRNLHEGRTSPVVRDFMNDVQLEYDENSQIYNHSDSDLNEDNTQKKSEGMRKWLPNRNFEQSESDVDDPHFTSPNKNSTQEVATDCIDLTSDYSETQTTDSSTATTITELPEYQEKPQKYSKDPMNNHLMARIVGKLMDEVPLDIDGNCKYLVKCCSENWLEKTKDGRWFHLRSTGKKDPNC